MVPTVKPQKWFYLNPPASWPCDGQRLSAVRGGSPSGAGCMDQSHSVHQAQVEGVLATCQAVK